MFNQVILMGYVGQPPEQRENGPVRFSLATSFKYKDKSGEQVEKTQWHNIVAWGKLGEIVMKYVHKGTLVHITGRVEYQKYEKNEETRISTQIVAEGMRMLPTGKKSDSAEGNAGPVPEPTVNHPAEEVRIEDIPF